MTTARMLLPHSTGSQLNPIAVFENDGAIFYIVEES